jgi:hypothetical protein
MIANNLNTESEGNKAMYVRDVVVRGCDDLFELHCVLRWCRSEEAEGYCKQGIDTKENDNDFIWHFH